MTAYIETVAPLNGTWRDEEQPGPVDEATLPGVVADPWPVLHDDALHGVAGDVVRAVLPHTEADPAALLLTLLTFAGAVIGNGPHVLAGDDRHPARLFTVLVGDTAKARKGTSFASVRRVMQAAVDGFIAEAVVSGFGSGEALIDTANEGDGRLLVYEPEFARILNVCRRDGSSLSSVIRDAWDGQRLQVRSRSKTTVCETDQASVSVIAHVTNEELAARLTDTEVANGFANRFVFALVRKSKVLPSGGSLDESDVRWLAKKMGDAITCARALGRMFRSAEAESVWDRMYRWMDRDDPGGLVGAVIARDAAQVLRLSVLYAALDDSRQIDVVHLRAAWAVWRYARQSAALIFRNSPGDAKAERILRFVIEAGDVGRTRNELHAHLGGHVKAVAIEAVVERLEDAGLVEQHKRRSGDKGGRPAKVVVATDQARHEDTKSAIPLFGYFVRSQPSDGVS